MKLAEALIERADLNQKLEELRYRMQLNAKTQEGLSPNESPKDLIIELNNITKRLEYLIIHINKTNNNTFINQNETISELITKKDILNKKISILNSLKNSGSELINRLSHSEIKIIPTCDINQLQVDISNLSKELRSLDTQIQGLNWTIDLI